ncbi:2-C-methyl-D-erythritol 2,4-cyclodiphosphate synthase [Bacteroidia bacterium]|nr:2-C-methyl-D-erythritol 2,4-cyclodiphosphate synthase [Bacteroidia bacterium]
MRIGIGYDVHALDDGLPLWLGGVKVVHSKGCVAHSDGDVLIHAICDALLGAACLRDIGVHFADTDPQWKGIDSKILLQKTVALLSQNGYSIGNVDSVIMLQQPKIKDYIPQMQTILAQTMGIAVAQMSVKATTTERLGFVGREEGIAAQAVCTIVKEN